MTQVRAHVFPFLTIFKLNTRTSYHKELKLSDESSTYHDEMNLQC